jgi:hypothetical protein
MAESTIKRRADAAAAAKRKRALADATLGRAKATAKTAPPVVTGKLRAQIAVPEVSASAAAAKRHQHELIGQIVDEVAAKHGVSIQRAQMVAIIEEVLENFQKGGMTVAQLRTHIAERALNSGLTPAQERQQGLRGTLGSLFGDIFAPVAIRDRLLRNDLKLLAALTVDDVRDALVRLARGETVKGLVDGAGNPFKVKLDPGAILKQPRSLEVENIRFARAAGGEPIPGPDFGDMACLTIGRRVLWVLGYTGEAKVPKQARKGGPQGAGFLPRLKDEEIAGIVVTVRDRDGSVSEETIARSDLIFLDNHDIPRQVLLSARAIFERARTGRGGTDLNLVDLTYADVDMLRIGTYDPPRTTTARENVTPGSRPAPAVSASAYYMRIDLVLKIKFVESLVWRLAGR